MVSVYATGSFLVTNEPRYRTARCVPPAPIRERWSGSDGCSNQTLCGLRYNVDCVSERLVTFVWLKMLFASSRNDGEIRSNSLGKFTRIASVNLIDIRGT